VENYNVHRYNVEVLIFIKNSILENVSRCGFVFPHSAHILIQEAQLMLTMGSTRLAVNQGQQT